MSQFSVIYEKSERIKILHKFHDKAIKLYKYVIIGAAFILIQEIVIQESCLYFSTRSEELNDWKALFCHISTINRYN